MMFGMIQEVVVRFIVFYVCIDKCKNIVGVVRYRRCVLWRAHTITIDDEGLAVHILEHDRLGTNDAKDENGIQQTCFP